MAASLRLDTALYGSAILLDRLLAFFLLPLLTRAISPTDYGLWTQTSVAAGLLVPVVLFALPTAIVRYFSGPGLAASRRRALCRLGLVPVLLLTAAVLLALQVPEAGSALVYGEGGHRMLVPMLLGMLAADATTEYAQAWLRSAGRIGWIAAALVLRSLLRYAAVLWLLRGGALPLQAWLGDYVLAQLVLAALVLCVALAAQRGAAAGAAMPAPREVLAFALPLVALSVFTSLNAFLDRFVLVHSLGLDTVAVYAAAVSLSTIPAAFYSVLGFTLFPTLARCWQEGRVDEVSRLLGRSVDVFLFLCVPVALWLAVAGVELLPLLATDSYRGSAAVFVLLGVSVTAFGVYQIVLYALLLDGRSRQVLALAVGATAINLALNLALAPRFGAAGAAASAALSSLVMVGVAAHLVHQVLAWRFAWRRAWRIVWRAALAALPMVWAVQVATPSLVVLAGAALCCGVFYLLLDIGRRASIARSVLFQ